MADKMNHLLNQKGGILVTTAIVMVVLIGMSALSVDLGLAYLERTEMTNAADLAALAAIKEFAKRLDLADSSNRQMIRDAAAITASLNVSRNNPGGLTVRSNQATAVSSTSANSDVIFGFYDYAVTDPKNRFTGYADNALTNHTINALQITVNLDGATNNAYVFSLAGIFQWLGATIPEVLQLRAQAVASFGIMNIVTVLDVSGSMKNLSYRPVSSCPYPMYIGGSETELYFNDTRFFHYAATTQPSPQQCYDQFCINAGSEAASCYQDNPKVFSPIDTAHGVVMPQPITDVFEVTRDVLFDNPLFSSMYRGGLIVYETTAYDPYVSSGSVVLGSDNLTNKAAMQTALNDAIETWKQFALLAADNPSPPFNESTQEARKAFINGLPSNAVFPGGLNPPHTGYTNIGDAIRLAVQWITHTNDVTQTKGKDTIILLSDGIPNCFRSTSENNEVVGAGGTPICKNHVYYPQFKVKGIEWSMQNAKLAADNEIIIHTIFFDTDDEGIEGFNHLKDIADMTGGKAYYANNIGDLVTAFQKLAQEQSFVLVLNE